jgi:hypothetical protein
VTSAVTCAVSHCWTGLRTSRRQNPLHRLRSAWAGALAGPEQSSAAAEVIPTSAPGLQPPEHAQNVPIWALAAPHRPYAAAVQNGGYCLVGGPLGLVTVDGGLGRGGDRRSCRVRLPRVGSWRNPGAMAWPRRWSLPGCNGCRAPSPRPDRQARQNPGRCRRPPRSRTAPAGCYISARAACTPQR